MCRKSLDVLRPRSKADRYTSTHFDCFLFIFLIFLSLWHPFIAISLPNILTRVSVLLLPWRGHCSNLHCTAERGFPPMLRGERGSSEGFRIHKQVRDGDGTMRHWRLSIQCGWNGVPWMGWWDWLANSHYFMLIFDRSVFVYYFVYLPDVLFIDKEAMLCLSDNSVPTLLFRFFLLVVIFVICLIIWSSLKRMNKLYIQTVNMWNS